jgi:hypothetical protein
MAETIGKCQCQCQCQGKLPVAEGKLPVAEGKCRCQGEEPCRQNASNGISVLTLTLLLSERLLHGLAERFSVHPAFRLFGRNLHDRAHLGLGGRPNLRD